MSPRAFGVLGAGSWGTALAVLLARQGNQVTLWCRDPGRAATMDGDRQNARYLPDHRFPETLSVTSDLRAAVAGADVLVGAVPSTVTRALAESVAEIGTTAIWVSATKGLERRTRLRMSEVVSLALGSDRVAVLSGPSFAAEVAAGEPTAVAVAAADLGLARRLQREFSCEAFRAYATSDLVGVELGGAFKNVIAIAAGMLAGLGHGHDPLAALVTRGLREITRLAEALGAEAATLAGLSGLGDLVLTCTSALSRNWRLGRSVAAGHDLERAKAELGQVAEGVETVERMVEIAAEVGLDAPIAGAVRDVLFGGAAARDAIRALMMRRLKDESQ